MAKLLRPFSASLRVFCKGKYPQNSLFFGFKRNTILSPFQSLYIESKCQIYPAVYNSVPNNHDSLDRRWSVLGFFAVPLLVCFIKKVKAGETEENDSETPCLNTVKYKRSTNGKFTRSNSDLSRQMERARTAKRKLEFSEEKNKDEDSSTPQTCLMTRNKARENCERACQTLHGYRIFDLDLLKKGLANCIHCLKGPLTLNNIVKEDIMGLASLFKIKCHMCGSINQLETSSAHRTGKRGKMTFNINSQAVLGCLHTGIGNTHLNNLLSTMNAPTMNNSTFKAREREVGNAVEHIAQTSCKENMRVEMNNAVSVGVLPDQNGLIGIPVSYDMGWQKRGRGHNSLTGHGAAMGLTTGNVVAYATRCKYCRICENAKKQGKPARSHDCRKNHIGSSKAMEPVVACELWNKAPTQNVKFSTYVGDDDTTTLRHLHQNVPYGVDKWSDIIHAKRSLTTRLYNLSTRCKFPNSSTLSQKVINYLGKCFTYCIAQNKDENDLKKGLKCIIPHAFGDHENCNPSWCGFKKDPLNYKHKDLPHNKDLQGNELRNKLTNLFDEYATDTVIKKLVPFANSQRNESLNSIIGTKNPKIRFYGASESSDFRVACGVAQKNLGYAYINCTLEHLGIDPGDLCISHNSKLDKNKNKNNIHKSSKASKVRRHQLQSQRISKNAKKEAKEGKTYETGIGLNLSLENTSVTTPSESNIENIIHTITRKQCEEFERLVPHCIERPDKVHVKYSPMKTYQFILFDIETSGTGTNAEICQLSAITQKGSTFSSYFMPKSYISCSASRVNNLTVIVIKGTRTLCKNSIPVESTSLENALEMFSKFIKDQGGSSNPKSSSLITVIIGHNAAVFDVPILLRNAGKLFDEQLDQMNVHFGDSLPLIKYLIQCKHSPLKLPSGEYCRANISSLYQCLFKDEFDAHDALEDVKALRKILFNDELAISMETIVNGCQINTIRNARLDLDYIDKRHDIFQTFVGKLYCPSDSESPVSQGMAQKIAGSGLSYEDLCRLYRKFGIVGVVGILNRFRKHDGRSKTT